MKTSGSTAGVTTKIRRKDLLNTVLEIIVKQICRIEKASKIERKKEKKSLEGETVEKKKENRRRKL
jgi:hypothetical protein